MDPTSLLERLERGDASASEELLPLLYGELRRTAGRLMERERSDHTFTPTALVHEAWMRLFGDEERAFASRRHFLRAAARAMRNVLVDHARARAALKRGGGERAPLDETLAVVEAGGLDVLALGEALDALGRVDPALVELVELRYFAGLSLPEIAAAQGSALRSLERGWQTARAFLQARLGDGHGP